MGFLHETCFLFFFFLGKHEDFPKREFLRLHAFMQSIM